MTIDAASVVDDDETKESAYLSRDEIGKLFELLRIYFPNAKKLGDERLKSAWLLLLEPYRPETVRQAVVAALRESVNLPDPQKIAVRCQALEPAEEPAKPPEPRGEGLAWMAPYIRRLAARCSEREADKLHAAGRLTWPEAEAAGMDFSAWSRACCLAAGEEAAP